MAFDKLYAFEVGKIIPEFKNHAEETVFDIDDSGGKLLVFFNNPTQNEIAQFQKNINFEIRSVEIQDVIMMTVKFGSLNWMDAPYTPHLSLGLTKAIEPKAGEGLTLFIMLIDVSTGAIKSLRVIGLSNEFTRNLLQSMRRVKEKEFLPDIYNINRERIFKMYKTTQIVKMSDNQFRLNSL